jgi:hypothetical protein
MQSDADFDETDAMQSLLTTAFMKGLALFDHALVSGNADSAAAATAQLVQTAAEASTLNCVPRVRSWEELPDGSAVVRGDRCGLHPSHVLHVQCCDRPLQFSNALIGLCLACAHLAHPPPLFSERVGASGAYEKVHL